MTLQGLELVLESATRRRVELEEQLGAAKRVREKNLRGRLSGKQWIASRFKLEAAHERLKQARALEARAEFELETARQKMLGEEREALAMGKAERNRMKPAAHQKSAEDIEEQEGAPSAPVDPEIEEDLSELLPEEGGAPEEMAAPSATADCTKAPEGWYCTREAGHEGPCAAVEKPSTETEVEAPRKPPCPYCGCRESTVQRTDGATRYRRCTGRGGCGRNFSTYEHVKK